MRLQNSQDLQEKFHYRHQGIALRQEGDALKSLLEYTINSGLEIAVKNESRPGESMLDARDAVIMLPVPPSGRRLQPRAGNRVSQSSPLTSVHASDGIRGTGRVIHLPLSAGEIPWEDIVTAIAQWASKNFFVIETGRHTNKERDIIDSFRPIEILVESTMVKKKHIRGRDSK